MLAALAEAKACRNEEDSDYSDLDDFIVCKEDRNYRRFIGQEFRYMPEH